MKRRSSPSDENHKESQCQNTCLNNRKKQRKETASSTTPPRPPPVCQLLPRKLHHSITTDTECEPLQPTLLEKLIARKRKHQQQQQPPVVSTSKIEREIGKPLHSSTLQPQEQLDPNAVTQSDLLISGQKFYGVEIIHPDALNHLRELYSKRTRMLNEMQNCENRLYHLERKLIKEGKQSQRDPSNNKICELRSSVDRLNHQLMQHVESLKELITRTKTDSSSIVNCQDQNQDHGRQIETETAESDRERTSAASSGINDDTENKDTDSEDEGEQQQQQQAQQMDFPNPNKMCPAQMAKPKDKQNAKIYGLQDTIQFLNETLKYPDGAIPGFETRGSSGSSGYATATDTCTGAGDTGGMQQIEALTVKAAAAMLDDETLLGPVIRKPTAPGRVACPYCGKDLTKGYLKQHIRNHCPKSSRVALVNDEVVKASHMLGKNK